MFENGCMDKLITVPENIRKKAMGLVISDAPAAIADKYQSDTACDDIERCQIERASEFYMSVLGGGMLIGAIACVVVLGRGAYDVYKAVKKVRRTFKR